MLFSSTTFIYLFLPSVLFLYYIVFRNSRKCKNIVLLLASLFFYAWGEPFFVLIMLLSITVNWLLGCFVGRCCNENKSAKKYVIIDVVFNLLILFVFKYLAFTMGIIKNVTGADYDIPIITLPIGISFFTFQAMSYVIDVYRGKATMQKNIMNVGLYISLFPQLIAGPIVRYETIADEIENRHENLEDFSSGFSRFILGLAKKVLLANNFALLADKAFNAVASGGRISVLFAWLGAIAYALQIFFDFGGYSDMAIGLGSVFGFHFPENFDYPYISTSVSEFWRRWHISLGTWFRDYVYIPLGGSRVRKTRLLFNLFVVWLLTGLWHGANYTFIVWGLLFFFLITVEKIMGIDKVGKGPVRLIKWQATMFFVIVGWVVFRSESITSAFRYISCMFGCADNMTIDGAFRGFFKQNLVLLVIGMISATPLLRCVKKQLQNSIAGEILCAAVLVLLFILSVASLASSTYNPFIYFNF